MKYVIVLEEWEISFLRSVIDFATRKDDGDLNLSERERKQLDNIDSKIACGMKIEC